MSKAMVVVGALVALASCKSEVEPPSNQLTAWSVRNNEIRNLGVGDDCRLGGELSCRSRLCLHTGTEPSSGFICSLYCLSNENCPDRWRCSPFLEQGVCLPPPGGDPAPSVPRVAYQARELTATDAGPTLIGGTP